jgi:hypothetical protein
MQQDSGLYLLSLEEYLEHDFPAVTQVGRRVWKQDETLDVKLPELDRSNPGQDLLQAQGVALAQW